MFIISKCICLNKLYKCCFDFASRGVVCYLSFTYIVVNTMVCNQRYFYTFRLGDTVISSLNPRRSSKPIDGRGVSMGIPSTSSPSSGKPHITVTVSPNWEGMRKCIFRKRFFFKLMFDILLNDFFGQIFNAKISISLFFYVI